MPRPYKTIDADDQDDALIAFFVASERDHYCHDINAARYASILASLPANHPFRPRIQELADQTASRLAEVTAILDATEPTLPSVGRINAAKARLKQKGTL